MTGASYEIRDAIHATIRFDERERSVINSASVQRLRHIRQLGSAYLLYPGATYSRFEHSLGTMELATRVFDTVMAADPDLPPSLLDLLSKHRPERERWRYAVRMAALCHDIGHLPFSHSAERELLPAGYTHERLTIDLIGSDAMRRLWEPMGLDADVVARLAVVKKYFEPGALSPWENVLAEIITGDALGVDRMDYLLRDSHHIGVAYGTIDHHRLIDTIRILPDAGDAQGLRLGIREGGLHSAEALMLARYLMFEQVYCHHVVQIYDTHLVDFLKAWWGEKGYDVRLDPHLRMSDHEVLAAMRAAYFDHGVGYESAKAIIERDHFKLLFEPTPAELGARPDFCRKVYEALRRVVPEKELRYRPPLSRTDVAVHFPVLMRDGNILNSTAISKILGQIPPLTAEYIFVSRSAYTTAADWLKKNRTVIL
jgi:uncharacterized protein